MKENVEKDETIEHRRLTAVNNGPEAATRAYHEVCYGHFATGKECRGSSIKAKRHQDTGYKLNHTSSQSYGTMDRNCAAEHAEELLRAMARKE